jgi:hypothetical protein
VTIKVVGDRLHRRRGMGSMLHPGKGNYLAACALRLKGERRPLLSSASTTLPRWAWLEEEAAWPARLAYVIDSSTESVAKLSG